MGIATPPRDYIPGGGVVRSTFSAQTVKRAFRQGHPPDRVRPTNHDRWFLIQLYRWFPSILRVLTIIRPETLVRWHRAGFRCYWRWKSRPLGGRPQIDTELRASIRRMSMENPVPVENQIRTYSWCNPPRIGRQRMRPALFTVRDRGASLSKAKCVRVAL
jgi:hypothetical protein